MNPHRFPSNGQSANPNLPPVPSPLPTQGNRALPQVSSSRTSIPQPRPNTQQPQPIYRDQSKNGLPQLPFTPGMAYTQPLHNTQQLHPTHQQQRPLGISPVPELPQPSPFTAAHFVHPQQSQIGYSYKTREDWRTPVPTNLSEFEARRPTPGYFIHPRENAQLMAQEATRQRLRELLPPAAPVEPVARGRGRPRKYQDNPPHGTSMQQQQLGTEATWRPGTITVSTAQAEYAENIRQREQREVALMKQEMQRGGPEAILQRKLAEANMRRQYEAAAAAAREAAVLEQSLNIVPARAAAVTAAKHLERNKADEPARDLKRQREEGQGHSINAIANRARYNIARYNAFEHAIENEEKFREKQRAMARYSREFLSTTAWDMYGEERRYEFRPSEEEKRNWKGGEDDIFGELRCSPSP